MEELASEQCVAWWLKLEQAYILVCLEKNGFLKYVFICR